MDVFENNRKSIKKIDESVEKLNGWCFRIKDIIENFKKLKASLKINGGEGLK